MFGIFSSYFNFLRNLVNNIVKFGIQGAILVGISYTFSYFTKWVTGALLQILLQIIIMGLALFFMDKIVSWMFGRGSTVTEGMNNYIFDSTIPEIAMNIRPMFRFFNLCWDDLTLEERRLVHVLGWTCKNWPLRNDKKSWPDTMNKNWCQLTIEEQKAVALLGMTPYDWDINRMDLIQIAAWVKSL